MSDNFVNLNDQGALTRAGQGYDADSQEGQGESRNFQSRMEGSQAGLRGRTGAQFTGLTSQHAGNLALLGSQFAEQALRAVRGEQTIVSSDDDAYTMQATSASTVDAQTSTINRPINAA